MLYNLQQDSTLKLLLSCDACGSVVVQDKLLQKQHFHSAGVPVADHVAVDESADAQAAVQAFGFPFMLKARRLAYDGRGNAVVRSLEELEGSVSQLGGYGQGLYAERWAPFVKVRYPHIVSPGQA